MTSPTGPPAPSHRPPDNLCKTRPQFLNLSIPDNSKNTLAINVSFVQKSATMEYLRIKRGAKKIRPDGSKFAVPIVINKTKKYGKVISEQYISRKQPILITGAHNAGKTRWASRLYDAANEIWTKYPAPALFLDPVRPLSSWADAECVMQWWQNKSNNNDQLKPWSKLKAWERQDKLPEYLSENKAILFIDNAHKLTGRKEQIAKECLQVQRLSVITINDEQRLPPSLRHLVLNRDPQIFRLGTDTAYDATPALVFFLALVALGAGWWEISLVLGGLTALSQSRRSARQD